MRYNIICISDIHWGCIKPKEELRSLEFLFSFIEKSVEKDLNIDLLVIAGDYFDSKLPLNSQEVLYAFDWFYRLYDLCKSLNIKMRMMQGTMDHDNDQLDAFDGLQDEEGFFKLFKYTTVEETLDGLKCCYCPDETIQTDEYEEIYLDSILEMKDLGFFHGSFDLVYGDLLEIKPELLKKNNVMYRYDLWNPQIKGPLIAGHWHDGKRYEELYYCGSPFRWKFNEDESKGFLFIQYNTDDSSYYVKKITNPLCAEYINYDVYSNTFHSKEDYVKIIDEVNEIMEKMKGSSLDDRLRINVYLVDDKVENDIFLSALRQQIVNHRNCKITIKNKLKDKKKKEKMKENKLDEEAFHFIFENKEPQDIIHSYVLTSTDNEMDIPIDYVTKKVKQYI